MAYEFTKLINMATADLESEIKTLVSQLNTTVRCSSGLIVLDRSIVSNPAVINKVDHLVECLTRMGQDVKMSIRSSVFTQPKI